MTALETAFPHLHFEITPVDLDDAPEMAQADLAIRFGRVKPDEKNEWLLMNEFVFPICSPSFASKYLISEVVTETQLSTVSLLQGAMEPACSLAYASAEAPHSLQQLSVAFERREGRIWSRSRLVSAR
jgi:hypothetical protein